MNRNKGVKLNMEDYKTRKGNPKKPTEQEKIARLYVLADKLNVQIGLERDQHDENDGVLFKRL